MRRAFFALQLLIVASGAALVALPLPPHLVERYYSAWFYPALQARLTSWSNDTGVSLFDFIVVVLVLVLLGLLGRALFGLIARRSLGVFGRSVFAAMTVGAVAYIWFELAWGLNYARVPLEDAIGYDRGRVTTDALRALALRAVKETNETYAAGHAAGFPAIGEIPPSLVTSMHEIERRIGRPRSTTPGRPKRTLLAAYFRASGVDGMHAPFMLETLLNPDLTPPERPAVLAHEWAHLAGFAPEDDASFVGLLAALRADPGARYSAWLTLAFEATSQLPAAERRQILGGLAAGPRRDQRAIAERLQSRIEVVQRASWETYDRYLKAQGVSEGIENYSRVVQLLIGSGALDW